MAWLGVSEIGPVVYVLQIMSGASLILTFSASSTRRATRSSSPPAHARGRAMTLVNGAFHLGHTSSVLVGGWVAESYGYSAAIMFGAMIAGAGVCTLIWDIPRDRGARVRLRESVP